MYTSRKKIHKDNDAEPTEFEETVAQVIGISNSWECIYYILNSILCIEMLQFDACAVPIWLREHQSGSEKWLERSLYKSSNVSMLWIIKCWFAVCLVTKTLLMMRTTYFMQSNGCGWESQGCSHLCALQIEEGIPQGSSSPCQRVGEKV